MTSVVINESVVRRLLENPEIQNLGCMKSRKVELTTRKRGCGKCGKKRNLAQLVTTSPGLSWAKKCLYGLTDEALNKVKAHLSVDRLVFYFNEPGFPQRAVR